MGSTGNASLSKRRSAKLDNETYGIKGAVSYKGSIPANSNLEKQSSNNVTLKAGNMNNPVLFQFKLSKDKKFMTITAFRDGHPEVKVKVDVDSTHPSLNQLLKSGSSSERQSAMKIKDLMSQSTEISEGQLGQIADNLKKKRTMNKD